MHLKTENKPIHAFDGEIDMQIHFLSTTDMLAVEETLDEALKNAASAFGETFRMRHDVTRAIVHQLKFVITESENTSNIEDLDGEDWVIVE